MIRKGTRRLWYLCIFAIFAPLQDLYIIKEGIAILLLTGDAVSDLTFTPSAIQDPSPHRRGRFFTAEWREHTD
jgi:hypothetical protein